MKKKPLPDHLMRLPGMLALASLFFCLVSARSPGPGPGPGSGSSSSYVRISSPMGSCIVRLYDQTPRHRDNFLKLVKEKKYDSLLFHRVIHGFMIQGGDPDSRHAKPDQALGDGDLGYTIPSEFSDSLIHKKGALAAARDDNPAKASSGIQFYLVQGIVFTPAALDSEANRRHYTLNDLQRKTYTSIGGVPHLDHNYTVFGEVVEGLDMVDSIAAVKTNASDRPVRDVPMNMQILSRREIRQLFRRLKKAVPKP